MNNNSHFNNLGAQMKSALNEALDTGDFEKLNSLVSDTVKTALKDAETTSKSWTNSNAQTIKEVQQRFERQREEQQRNEQQKRELAKAQKYYMKTGLLVKVENVGLVAGILFIVFGAIANVPLFILSLIAVLAVEPVAAGWLLFFLALSIFFICKGKDKIQLINRAKRYVKLCGSKMYEEIEVLATQVGISPKKVVKELRKILRKGIIPSAHIDTQATHLMLNEVVYKQYIDAEKARVLLETEKKNTDVEQTLSAEAEETQQKTELEQMISEGQDYIRKLRDMNDLIAGEVISTKLYRLENLLKEIFERVQKEPAQMNRMHKVMSYYLPTTLKLVEAYYEFDRISNPGKEIISAKEEIEATIDAINEAFVELLNNLFQDRVFDITTDAQVLQTMLASEGLTREMDLVNVNGGE